MKLQHIIQDVALTFSLLIFRLHRLSLALALTLGAVDYRFTTNEERFDKELKAQVNKDPSSRFNPQGLSKRGSCNAGFTDRNRKICAPKSRILWAGAYQFILPLIAHLSLQALFWVITIFLSHSHTHTLAIKSKHKTLKPPTHQSNTKSSKKMKVQRGENRLIKIYTENNKKNTRKYTI